MPRRAAKGPKGAAKPQVGGSAAAAPPHDDREPMDAADGGDGSGAAAHRSSAKLADRDASPVVAIPQPDYLFEMLFLAFFVLHLLLQNYNVNYDDVDRYNRPFIAFAAVFFTKRVMERMMESSWVSWSSGVVGKVFQTLLSIIPALALFKSIVELSFQHDIPTLYYLIPPYCLYRSLFDGGFDTLRKYTPDELAADPAASIMLGFRQQLKHVVYGTIEAGYFVAMLPARFITDRHAVFDRRTAVMLAVYGAVNAAVLLTCNLVSTRFAEFRQQTKAIGCWKEVRTGVRVEPWSLGRDWRRGEQVRHSKKLYIAEGTVNRCEPDDWIAWAFYRMFRHPRHMVTNIVLLELFVIVSQVAILCVVRKWQAVANWGVLVMLSYGVLLYALHVRRKVLEATRPQPP